MTNREIADHAMAAVLGKIQRLERGGLPFHQLREEPLAFAIGRRFRDHLGMIIIPEMRYALMPGVTPRSSRTRADLFAIRNRLAIAVEIKAGGPLRTDANSQAVVEYGIKQDIARLAGAGLRATRRVCVVVLHAKVNGRTQSWQQLAAWTEAELRRKRFAAISGPPLSHGGVVYMAVVGCR